MVVLAAYLAVVLLAIDSAAGLALVFADILALITRDHAVGLSHTLILTDVGFAGFEAGGFGAVELAGSYALANAGLLVVLVGCDAGSSGLGCSGEIDGEQGHGGEYGKQGLFHRRGGNGGVNNAVEKPKGGRGLMAGENTGPAEPG